MSNERGSVPEGDIEHSICAARDGSLSAVGKLLDLYRDYLLAIANDELSSDIAQKCAPSDVVQEACYQATRNFAAFRGGTEAELKAWLRQITYNCVRDAEKQYRHAQKRDCSREVPLEPGANMSGFLHSLTSDVPSASSAILSEEVREALARAVANLSAEQQQVINGRCVAGQTFEEIGQSIGKSADAARKVWLRAVEELAREVAKDDSRERRQR